MDYRGNARRRIRCRSPRAQRRLAPGGRAVVDAEILGARREAALASYGERAAHLRADGVDAAPVVGAELQTAFVGRESERELAVLAPRVGHGGELGPPRLFEAAHVVFV